MTETVVTRLRGLWLERIWPRLEAWRDRPLLLCTLSGLLTALAHPPFGFLPGLFGYGLWLYALEREAPSRPWRTTFLRGWLAGFAYFLVGCYWVAEAFLVFADSYGWMAPFAALLLPAGMALFWGLTAVIYRWIGPRGVWRFVAFAAILTLVEMIRGTVFGGFPWNPAGASWRAGSAMSQFASIFGVHGLSLITVLTFASIATWRRDIRLKGYIGLIASMVILLTIYTFGLIRLYTGTVLETDYIVRVVQPNVSQREKWTPEAFDDLFTAYVDLSRAAPRLDRAPDVIIWPEGALPPTEERLFSERSWTAPILLSMLEPGQSLIMGVTREEPTPKGWVWRNALMVMTNREGQSQIVGYYNKHKLVPFGEYMPGASLVRHLKVKALNNFVEGFTPGDRADTVSLADIPRFQPLICFESIFPHLNTQGYAGSNDPARPHWIVNASNDAWFGHTSGPRQHLNLASYRAIEEGLPMVRSTPTGISGLVDPYGRMKRTTELDQNQKGYQDFRLLRRTGLTIYASIGNITVSIVVFSLLIFMSRGGSLHAALGLRFGRRRES